MPQIKIVWSQILPRFSWRYSDNFEAMERSRRRLNNCIASCQIRQFFIDKSGEKSMTVYKQTSDAKRCSM